MFDEQLSLKEIVENSIKLILINDQIIIRTGQEWALSNKLGMYLFRDFPGWDVDCEYNRVGFGDDQKRTELNERKRPDIIIHRRGLTGKDNNLLWIEVKVRNDNIRDDIEKLKEFTSELKGERTIQYKYGLSVSFRPSTKTTWVTEGEVIE